VSLERQSIHPFASRPSCGSAQRGIGVSKKEKRHPAAKSILQPALFGVRRPVSIRGSGSEN
jgi:hypothetical protein